METPAKDNKDNSERISIWLNSVKSRFDSALYRMVSVGLLWKEQPLLGDEPIGGRNSEYLKEAISQGGFPVLDEHDPGRVIGTVLDYLEIKDGEDMRTLYGAIAVFEPRSHITFGALGCSSHEIEMPCTASDPPGTTYPISLAVPSTYLSDSDRQELLSVSKSIKVEFRRNLLYSSELGFQLWEVSAPIALLLIPFAKQLGQDLAKDFHSWLKSLAKRVSPNKSSIVTLRTYYQTCDILLLMRSELSSHDANARDAELSIATSRACELIEKVKSHQMTPRRLTMEYSPNKGWQPSNILLRDGRIIWDGVALQDAVSALDSNKSGLSLGLTAVETEQRRGRVPDR